MNIQDILSDVANLDTTQGHIDFYMRERRCQCDGCKTSAKFASIVNKLTDEEDQKWMLGFMESVCEKDEHSGMELAYYDRKVAKMQNQIDALELILSDILNGDPTWEDCGVWEQARERGAFVGMPWESEAS